MSTFNQWPCTAVVYGHDLIDGGWSLGPGTINRLQRVVNASRIDGFNIPAVVVTAGISPDKKTHYQQSLTMAVLMRQWLCENSHFPRACIYESNRSRVWTSMEETFEAMRIIRLKKLPTNILVVSSRDHLFPRLFLTWHILKPPGWKIATASHPRRSSSVTHEFLGTMKYVPWALKERGKH